MEENLVSLAIQLFGSVQVTLDGKPVEGFASDKVRALLAYLVMSPDQPQRREKLAGLLWPDFPERSARTSLRNSLANLRKVIGDKYASPPFFHITRQTIQFNQYCDHWLDVDAFTALLTASQPNFEAYREAISLYQGDFLEGFFVADSNPFEDWTSVKREHYQRLVLDAFHRIIEICELQGVYERGLPYAWRVVEMEPWEEAGQRALMRLLALSDRRSEALTQFKKSRQVLSDELGVEPSTETTELYEAIRSGEFVSSVVSETARTIKTGLPLPSSLFARIVNLPSVRTPFIGREDELAALDEILADTNARLVTIVGPGGIGKTRLALEVGGSASGDGHTFTDGVVFVELAPLSSIDQIIPAIAEALHLRLEEGEDQLLIYLSQKKIMLILDNFEHLLDGVNLVDKILHAAPGVQILATSRERLKLSDEHVFPLQGLTYPSQEIETIKITDVDVGAFIEAYSSAKLFIQTSHRFQPQLVLTDRDLMTLSNICRLVEGMPLALELAASWVDTLSLEDILSEIQVSNDFLRTEWSDIPQRQRSIRAVFDSSWERLSQEEQTVFSRFSVFRGGFTREAAHFVAMKEMDKTVFLKLLSRLVRKSFLRFDPAKKRYQVHELLRQYGEAKLSKDSTQETEVRDRHSRYFCDWLTQREEVFKSASENIAIKEIKNESENLRTACLWAAAYKQVSRLFQTVIPLGYYYQLFGYFQTGKITFQYLSEHMADFDIIPPPKVEIAQQVLARIYIWQGNFCGILGDRTECKILVDKSLVILDGLNSAGLDTRLERAQAFLVLGYTQYNSNPQTAEQYFCQSRDLYQEIGDRWGLVRALTGLGRAYRNMYAYQEAHDVITQNLDLSRDIGNQEGYSDSLMMLGYIAQIQGRSDEAVRLRNQGLSMTPKYNPIGIALGMCGLGYALACSGEFSGAETRISNGLGIFQELGTRREYFFNIIGLNWINLHTGKYQEVLERGLDALDQARQLSHRRAIVAALENLGMIALTRKDYGEAQERFQESINEFRQLGRNPDEGGSVACLGLALRGMGYRTEAWNYLKAGLGWAVEEYQFYPLMNALSGIALMLSDEGEYERALELYTLALKHPYVANSCWFEDVAGIEIEANSEKLPQGVAEAARAKGDSLDLWQGAAELLSELHD
jgi:predicted ATPase/DNA-binding SARP family transcriptional activator